LDGQWQMLVERQRHVDAERHDLAFSKAYWADQELKLQAREQRVAYLEALLRDGPRPVAGRMVDEMSAETGVECTRTEQGVESLEACSSRDKRAYFQMQSQGQQPWPVEHSVRQLDLLRGHAQDTTYQLLGQQQSDVQGLQIETTDSKCRSAFQQPGLLGPNLDIRAGSSFEGDGEEFGCRFSELIPRRYQARCPCRRGAGWSWLVLATAVLMGHAALDLAVAGLGYRTGTFVGHSRELGQDERGTKVADLAPLGVPPALDASTFESGPTCKAGRRDRQAHLWAEFYTEASRHVPAQFVEAAERGAPPGLRWAVGSCIGIMAFGFLG